MNCDCILTVIFRCSSQFTRSCESPSRNWQKAGTSWLSNNVAAVIFAFLYSSVRDEFFRLVYWFKLVHIFLRHRSWAEQRHLCYLSVAREKQFTRFFSAQTKTGILKGFQDWGVYVQKHSLTRRTITRHSVNKGANIVKQTISLFITIISIKHPI